MDFNSIRPTELISALAATIAVIGAIVKLITVLYKKIKRNRPTDIISANLSDQVVLLNEPEKVYKDDLLGRDEFLKKIYNTLKKEDPISFIGNHIFLAGGAGIGKTHFCQSLFSKLRYSNNKICIGWIECNGVQPIYDIVSEKFIDNRFKGMKKDHILMTIKDLGRPCVLFIDQVDHHTPIEEIKELKKECPNTTLVVSGLLKGEYINFIDDVNHFHLKPLPSKIIEKIFEGEINKKIDFMESSDRTSVNKLISSYINGNPFLAIAFAKAKAHNNNSWNNMLLNMKEVVFDSKDNNFIRDILEKLYRIPKLNEEEKSTLSKLCIFSSLQYTREVFNWGNMPIECVTRLCKTHWLTQKDNMFYGIDDIHRDVLNKVFDIKDNLRELIEALTEYLYDWKIDEDKGFKQISLYVEDILIKVKGYVPILERSYLFTNFAYIVANKYHYSIRDSEKSLKWLNLCDPINSVSPKDIVLSIYEKQSHLEEEKRLKLRKDLIYNKAVLEFHVKIGMLFSLFDPSEVYQTYLQALEAAKFFDNFEEKQRYLIGEYCVFLSSIERYDDVKSLCKEYFGVSGFTLNNDHSCTMFYRYLCAAIDTDDEEALKLLVNNEIIESLWKNNMLNITVAWSFGKFYQIFKKEGNDELAELCKRRMVILINRKKRFWHQDIRDYIKMSDEEYLEYMHSHDELLESLEEAINREDADALYLEGRYQEKHGNYNEAFSFYEQSAKKDNLKGICSLALMYYRGSEYYEGLEEIQNYDKAREYWEYCNDGERKHRGSYYWLGIMLLDEKYKGYDKELGIQKLNKAVEMGSRYAKQKLQELQDNLLPVTISLGA